MFKKEFGSALVAPWKRCWDTLGSDAEISAAEAEVALSDGSRSGTPKIVLNPTVKLNEQQYRGNLESVRHQIAPQLPDTFLGQKLSRPSTSSACTVREQS